jgi:pyridoxal phosphate enzyme (YggS family)
MDRIEWHMIGHVQSRKARDVCVHFDWVHSVDSLKLARRLERFSAEQESNLPILLECNVSGEESKFGFPAWEERQWGELLPEFEQIAKLPHLDLRGLMTIAPYLPEAEPARPFFRRLRRLQGYLLEEGIPGMWKELSMGMSGDFEVAIQEGSTMIRVGTAIFGERPN